MQRLLMAFILIGLCFGATVVSAASSEVRCRDIKQMAVQNLDGYDTQIRNMISTTNKALEEYREHSFEHDIKKRHFRETAEKNLNLAAQWATIYTAFCKK